MTKLINAVGFQAGWWACIYGAGHGFEIEALFFCLALISTHLYFSRFPWQEAMLGLIALLLGIWLDSWLQHASVITFYGWSLRPLSPFWLWALWVLFALTLNSSLEFLKHQSQLTCAVLGLVFGPLNYFAGANLGAAKFDASAVHICSLALAWMLAMPLLVKAAQHISPTPSPTPKDNT